MCNCEKNSNRPNEISVKLIKNENSMRRRPRMSRKRTSYLKLLF